MWYDELTEDEVKKRFEWANTTLSDDAIELLYKYYQNKSEDVQLDAYMVENEWTEYDSVKDAVDALADNPQEVYGHITDEYADRIGQDRDTMIDIECSNWLDFNTEYEVVFNHHCCCVKKR